MDTVSLLPAGTIGKNFIPAEFLLKGSDEYHFRNAQTFWPKGRWRRLKQDEMKQLAHNNNTSGNWEEILVTGLFYPSLLVNNRFFGLVRIG